MRLLHTTTYQLHEFHSKLPPYAILSHTWVEGGEVSFEEISNQDLVKRLGNQDLVEETGNQDLEDKRLESGLRKIKRCCSKAAFLWI
jgi:hypothetical protein